MKKHVIFILLMPFALWGQVSDNFSDGDFTQNPSWTGDPGHFKVSSSTAIPEDQRPALQLNAPAAGRSALAVASDLSGNLEWHCWIKLSMNTSQGNYARIYLLSDKDSLKEPLQGYFLQLGGEDDSVDFYRQDSAGIIHLLRLHALFTGNSTNALRLRVTRSADGSWQFYGDGSGTSLLQPVGETSDMLCPAGNYFGIFCQYTASNTTKFYFDDLYAGPLIVDTIPPGIASVSAANLTKVLQYHVVSGNVLAASLTEGQIVTPILTPAQTFTIQLAGGAKIKDANDRISTIVATDVQCSNGVIHVLDKVLLPRL